MDILIGILIGSFFLCVFYYSFEAIAISIWISKQGCGSKFLLSAAPGWAIKRYVAWCSETGTHINTNRLHRYQLATRALSVGFALLTLGIVLIIAGA